MYSRATDKQNHLQRNYIDVTNLKTESFCSENHIDVTNLKTESFAAKITLMYNRATSKQNHLQRKLHWCTVEQAINKNAIKLHLGWLWPYFKDILLVYSSNAVKTYPNFSSSRMLRPFSLSFCNLILKFQFVVCFVLFCMFVFCLFALSLFV